MYGNHGGDNGGGGNYDAYGQSPYTQGGYAQQPYDQQQQQPPQQQYGGYQTSSGGGYGDHQQQQQYGDVWQQQQQPQTFSHVQVPAGAAPSDDEWFSSAASSTPIQNANNAGGASGFGGGQKYTSNGFNMPTASSGGNGGAAGPPSSASFSVAGPKSSSSSSSSMSNGFGATGSSSFESAQKYTSHGFNPPPVPEASMGNASSGPVSYEDEPPLLEELGINFDHIRTKTIAVIVPTKTIEPDILADTDMAGPLVFALVQGFCLMLSGKLFFGYVFGFGVMGCLFIYLVVNLMNHAGNTVIDIYRVCSVLGYCLLPIVLLSAVTVLFDLSEASAIGTPLTLIAILWCTQTATRFFEAATQMSEQRYLIAYPVFLLYACFALITVF